MGPDPAALAAFAAWVTAAAERLLIYPGGLFVAAATVLLAWALPRLLPQATRAPTLPPAPVAGTAGLGPAVPALALAWAAWALLPLPGAPGLPTAPDLLSPLALLLAATLLDRSGNPDPAAWRREAAGRPLLLAAPLVALAALGLPGLLPPGTIAAGGAEVARALAALAYVAGWLVCYGAPGSAPWARAGDRLDRAAAWMVWWGWLGAGAALGPAAVATATAPPWAGVGLVALLAAAAAGFLVTPVARSLAGRLAPWGWAALGGALLGVLLGV